MIKHLMFLLFIGLSSTVAQAAKPNQHILIDGSVARCSEMADYGSRAFRLTMIESSNSLLKFRLENLVCVNSADKMVHIPYALSRPFVHHKDGRTLSYEYTKGNVVVLNNEATAVYQTIAINPQLSSQEFSMNAGSLKTFDLSLQALEVIKIDGQFFDQGMVAGGSYRIRFK
jgi:hypothetical protein